MGIIYNDNVIGLFEPVVSNRSENTIFSTEMFKCKECEATEFKLMLQPSFQGQVEITTNEHDEVVISVAGKEFIADLLFMNQFAVCANCDAIKCWDYFFPKKESV